MDHFYIVANVEKDPGHQVAEQIRTYLENRGKTCLLDVQSEEDILTIPEGTDCVIVLGGDGTLLRTAGETVESKVPLIGVNLGNMGYLAEVESSNVEEALQQLISGNYTQESRMMLAGTFLPAGEQEKSIKEHALNEIAITRNGSLQVSTLHIYVNGLLLTTYEADGVLLSTPTGSTGYNLSAGGPIVNPQAKLILLTPICPHTLQSRTIVLSAEDEVTVEIGGGRHGEIQKLEASFDGRKKIQMKTGDKIEIRKSGKTTEILKLSQVSFIEVLHKKMQSQ